MLEILFINLILVSMNEAIKCYDCPSREMQIDYELMYIIHETYADKHEQIQLSEMHHKVLANISKGFKRCARNIKPKKCKCNSGCFTVVARNSNKLMEMSEAYFNRGCGTCDGIPHILEEDSDLYHSDDVYELVSRTGDEIVCVSCKEEFCNNMCKEDILEYAEMQRQDKFSKTVGDQKWRILNNESRSVKARSRSCTIFETSYKMGFYLILSLIVGLN